MALLLMTGLLEISCKTRLHEKQEEKEEEKSKKKKGNSEERKIRENPRTSRICAGQAEVIVATGA